VTPVANHPGGQTVTNESTGGNSTLALSGVVTDDGTLVEQPPATAAPSSTAAAR